jgi:hypothetical protein
MNTRTALALALVSLLSTVAGCARSGQTAASPMHPVIAFAAPGTAGPAAEQRPARFEVETPMPTHIDPAGAARR